MVIVAEVYESEIVLTGFEEEGNLYMIVPTDSVVHKFVEFNHNLKLRIDGSSNLHKCYVNDNRQDIENIFLKMKDANISYFEELTSDLVLIVATTL